MSTKYCMACGETLDGIGRECRNSEDCAANREVLKSALHTVNQLINRLAMPKPVREALIRSLTRCEQSPHSPEDAILIGRK